MIYNTNRDEQTIVIEGMKYAPSAFRCEAKLDFKDKSEFHHQVYSFLNDWFSESEILIVKTSGSTGIPKQMQVEKERMMQSAIMTCSYLQLKKDDTALLCMSVDFIAGRMMIVRALVCGFDLYPIPPSGNPLRDTCIDFDFVAMTPMQVYNCLQNEAETNRLKNIKNLIIGGSAIDVDLEKRLQSFPNRVYSTYGMTETLSHIALRRLNGNDASPNYYPLPNIRISLSDERTLEIDAPLITKQKLVTNDIAVINIDNSFRIIGRKDNSINSGGIKIQIEEVEAILKSVIYCPFAVTSLPDPKFGEIVVLIVENENQIDRTIFADLLPKHSIPKRIIEIDKIPLTETGKIDRATLKQLIHTVINEK